MTGSAPTAARTRRAPGESELWILILGDMAVFALFFGVWTWNQHEHPAVFAAGQAEVDQVIGFTNTVLLLTSSLAVALALEAVRRRRRDTALRAYLVALGLGLGFVVLKAVEYTHHARSGHSPGSSDFFMDYFVFTGIHLVHVLVGLAGLVFLAVRTRRTDASETLVEGISTFWHVVDLFWIVLFFCVYLS